MIAFEDLLVAPPRDLASVTPLAEARPGVEQVRLPFREVADLDTLAGIDSVRSAIGGNTVIARVPLPHIRELTAVRTDTETLQNLPNLEALMLQQPVDVEAVPAGLRLLAVDYKTFNGFGALERFERLERLRVSGAFLGSVEPLGRLTSLRWLALAAKTGIRGLGNLTGLEELRLELVNVSPANLKALARMTALRRLKVDGPLKSLEGIQGLRALEYLFLDTPAVKELSPLAGLPALAEVRIDQPRKLEDPSALGALPALRHLRYRAGTMTRLGFIATIGFLRDHPRLEVLELIDTAVADGDLSPLATMPRLRFAGYEDRTPEPPYRQLPDGTWSIFRDVAPLLDVEDNFDAEQRVRALLDPEVAGRLTFDSEPDMLGISAADEEDIKAAAAAIVSAGSAASGRRRPRRRP